MAFSTQTQPPTSGWTRRRLVMFALSMSPLIALLALLAWGQLRTGGSPGGLLEYSESGEQDVAQRTAPAFAGLDLVHGGQIDNAAVAGKIVMVDFWSSWCGACRIEAADLAAVYKEYADQPVEFVGLAIWDVAGDVLKHLDEYSVAYPNIIDDEGKTAVHYGVRGVPEKFFIDANGTIVRKLTGPVSPERLREILDDLLAS